MQQSHIHFCPTRWPFIFLVNGDNTSQDPKAHTSKMYLPTLFAKHFFSCSLGEQEQNIASWYSDQFSSFADHPASHQLPCLHPSQLGLESNQFLQLWTTFKISICHDILGKINKTTPPTTFYYNLLRKANSHPLQKTPEMGGSISLLSCPCLPVADKACLAASVQDFTVT